MKYFFVFIICMSIISCNEFPEHGPKYYEYAGIIESKNTSGCKGYIINIENDTAQYIFYNFPPHPYIDSTKFPQHVLLNYTPAGNCDNYKIISIRDMQVRSRSSFGNAR